MIKKIAIVLVIALFAFIGFLPEITRFGYNYAMKPENQSKGWAEGLAVTSAKINMRFWRYETAGAMLETIRKTWPNHPESVDFVYDIALCYEKSGQHATAIQKYRAFAAKYPNHRWHGQAIKRADNLEANLD